MVKNLKKYRYKKLLYIIVLLMVLSLNISIHNLNKNKNSIITEKQEKIKLFAAQESDTTGWFIESHTEEWLENGDFEDDDEGWESSEEGDKSDVDSDISDGEANFIISGETRTFTEISGIPQASEWDPVENPQFPSFPDHDEINESGCNAYHYWVDPTDAFQMTSIHWDRNVSMPVDMSDYEITSVTLNAVVNASVTTTASVGQPYQGGVDCPGDTIDGTSIDFTREYDYVRFYVLVSDLDKNDVFEMAFNQSTNLGQDSGPEISTMENTQLSVKSEESLISYLTTVLEKDSSHKQFTITLGIRIYCADNGQGDQDYWDNLRIKSCDFSFTYEKKMDRETSVSWEQVGEEISGRNIEITDAELNFDYKIDDDWPSASPNSEIRIYINDKEHTETIELSEAKTSFEEASDDGFDVTDLIKKDKDITLTIQIFIADEFGLDHPITISIDDISLVISYDVLIPPEQSLLFQILFIVACVSAACIAGYLVYYQRVLKYPKPVRKVRKYRKKLRKIKMPNIPIITRESAFNGLYTIELGNLVSLSKQKPSEKIAVKNSSKNKSLGRSHDKISKKSINKNTNNKLKEKHGDKNFSFLIIILLLIGLFLNILILPLNANQNTIHRKEQIKVNFLAQESDTSEWFVESYEKEWLENGDFDDGDDKWENFEEGDKSDVDASVSGGEANFIVAGMSNEYTVILGTPNSSTSKGWKQVNNINFPDLPDSHEINEWGCHASHEWVERADQSPSVQWDINVSMPDDMSDYIITSVSLSTLVNATVEANNGGLGGIDVPGDTGIVSSATYDYVRFYLLVSDVPKNKVYEIGYNQTTDLGDDDAGATDDMDDTYLINVPQDKLIEYLTSVLRTNNRNFTITLGIRIWCEDNFQDDQDNWLDLWIKSCNLTITYVRKIDQLTSVSWEQVGDEISGRNIEITDAELNFEYKVDKEWEEDLSPNSEIRIFISDEEYKETIKLTEAKTSFEEASDDGFDVTDLISKNEDISVEIQVFLADEFGLVEDITVSIDEVTLVISYDVLNPPEESILFQILLIIATVAAGSIAGYLIYYQRVLKYPKPVRKVRKYRRTLKKRRTPDVSITSRESAFKALYSAELSKTTGLFKAKVPEKVGQKDKILKKPLGISTEKTPEEAK